MSGSIAAPVRPPTNIMESIKNYPKDPLNTLAEVARSVNIVGFEAYFKPMQNQSIRTGVAKKVAGHAYRIMNVGKTENEATAYIDAALDSTLPENLRIKVANLNPGDWMERDQAERIQEELSKIMCK